MFLVIGWCQFSLAIDKIVVTPSAALFLVCFFDFSFKKMEFHIAHRGSN